MTTTATATDPWTQQFEQLKARYKHVRTPILAALNILLHDPDIGLEDAKARAQLHGVRITAASVAAAHRLRAQADAVPATSKVAPPSPAPATPRQPRRARVPSPALDAASMIQEVVQKLHRETGAEAERLRAAMRKAMSVLQAAVEA